MTVAIKEDRKNFLANFAFAEMNRDVAEQSSGALVPTSGLPRFSLFKAEEIIVVNARNRKLVVQ